MGEKKEYIERGALVEFVKQNTPHIDGDTTMRCVERALKAAPAADVVEVRHGEWEIVIGSDGKEKMVCTNCRHQQDLASTFTYCPNCGAKMVGKRKEQT